jgi:hypothetical protein
VPKIPGGGGGGGFQLGMATFKTKMGGLLKKKKNKYRNYYGSNLP